MKQWHPHKPLITAVGVDSGRVYIWTILTPQRWSALAPDFVEVEENVEYVEREDEFDIQPLEEIYKRRLDLEDEEVDVLTVDNTRAELSTAELHMPILLDISESDSEDEVVAIGTGQYRRKSPNRSKEWEENLSFAANGREQRHAKKFITDNSVKSMSQAKRSRIE